MRPELFVHPRTIHKNAVSKKDFNQDSFNSDCTPDPTIGEVLQDGDGTVMLEDEADELLQKLAARNYYRWAWEQYGGAIAAVLAFSLFFPLFSFCSFQKTFVSCHSFLFHHLLLLF